MSLLTHKSFRATVSSERVSLASTHSAGLVPQHISQFPLWRLSATSLIFFSLRGKLVISRSTHRQQNICKKVSHAGGSWDVSERRDFPFGMGKYAWHKMGCFNHLEILSSPCQAGTAYPFQSAFIFPGQSFARALQALAAPFTFCLWSGRVGCPMEQGYTLAALLWLTSFAQPSFLGVHRCCPTYQSLFPFLGWIIWTPFYFIVHLPGEAWAALW